MASSNRESFELKVAKSALDYWHDASAENTFAAFLQRTNLAKLLPAEFLESKDVLDPAQLLAKIIETFPTSPASQEIFTAAATGEDIDFISVYELRIQFEKDKLSNPTSPLLKDREATLDHSEKLLKQKAPFLRSTVAFLLMMTQFQRAPIYRNLKAYNLICDSEFQSKLKKCENAFLFSNFLGSFGKPGIESESLLAAINAVIACDLSGPVMTNLYALVGNHLKVTYPTECALLYSGLGENPGFSFEVFVQNVMPLVFRGNALKFLEKYASVMCKYRQFKAAISQLRETHSLNPCAPFELMTTYLLLLSQFQKTDHFKHEPAKLSTEEIKADLAQITLPLLDEILMRLLSDKEITQHLDTARGYLYTEESADFSLEIDVLLTKIITLLKIYYSESSELISKNLGLEKTVVEQFVLPKLLRNQAIQFLKDHFGVLSSLQPALVNSLAYCAKEPLESPKSVIASSLQRTIVDGNVTHSQASMGDSKTARLKHSLDGSTAGIHLKLTDSGMHGASSSSPSGTKFKGATRISPDGLPPRHPVQSALSHAAHSAVSPRPKTPVILSPQIISKTPSSLAKAATLINDAGGLIRGLFMKTHSPPATTKASVTCQGSPEVLVKFY